jgi:BCCIP
MKHFMKVSKGNGSFEKALSNLLEEGSNGDVGLVLSERIINMPAAVAPPSYKMLLEEIQWANEDVFRLLVMFD